MTTETPKHPTTGLTQQQAQVIYNLIKAGGCCGVFTDSVVIKLAEDGKSVLCYLRNGLMNTQDALARWANAESFLKAHGGVAEAAKSAYEVLSDAFREVKYKSAKPPTIAELHRQFFDGVANHAVAENEKLKANLERSDVLIQELEGRVARLTADLVKAKSASISRLDTLQRIRDEIENCEGNQS